ncbi:MFS general substrate transporter [Bimuria novae-zelandiae CBS 107.79]|uniref:MFS general substrate transporter n=1 Tax=Bimuria novae-zelandiae CBS 107.79 TaxID=1447943 RepID=A0A6A5UND8_9PLEO|nr:MFS general substrate transporter [Bimuria novae-zelandiae CBS 107.79]
MADEKPSDTVFVAQNARDVSSALEDPRYITGWRLHGISFFLLVALFVAQMDTSITSTSILTITDQLGEWEKNSWVFTAYMLSFCGFQLTWAKFSDTITRKIAFLMSTFIFTVFSGACGASQTLTQLIMFRWVQGIGGCGIFALTQLVFFELVPSRKWPVYVTLVTVVIAISLIAGPLVGGAIALTGHWRWIFLINVPICGIAFIGTILAFPNKLWNEPAARHNLGVFSFASFRRLDLIGSFLLLGACLLVTTGLEQAAIGYAWTSPLVLPLILMTAPFLVAFLVWEWYITTRREVPEPVFPWPAYILRNTYFAGSVLMICLVQIPQRYMTVNGLSSLDAAVRLLSFGALVPSSSTFAAALMGKLQIPPSFIILAGSVLQLIGAVLFSRVPSNSDIHPDQYGYQVILGVGVGFVMCGLILLVPFVMEERDLSVGTASIAQFRVLGGLIGIAIATSLSTPYLRENILEVVSPSSALLILEKTVNIYILPVETRREVERIFAESFSLQSNLLIGFAAAQIPTTALMWTMQSWSP